MAERRLFERYAQLPLIPVYRIAGIRDEYPTLLEAAKALGRVTYNPDAELVRYQHHWKTITEDTAGSIHATHEHRRPTIVNEVTAVTPAMKPLLRPMLRDGPGVLDTDCESMAHECIAAIRAHLRDALEGDRHYVMPHSAGYDSRLLSLILADMGASPPLLVAWEPEAEAALEIMSMLWPKACVPHIMRQQRDEDDYFGRFLRDFAFLGRAVSDPVRWMDGYHWLAWIAWPNNTGLLSAVFADESLAWASTKQPSLAYMLAGFMFDNPSPCASCTRDWILPFASLPWLRVLTSLDIDAIEPEEGYSRADTLKREMIWQLDARLLEYPNPRYELAARNKAREVLECHLLSEATMDAMRRNLAKSYYCRERTEWVIGEVPRHVSPYCTWLREYTTAAIIEAMVDEGVEVVV
jgi:hypothetical protein